MSQKIGKGGAKSKTVKKAISDPANEILKVSKEVLVSTNDTLEKTSFTEKVASAKHIIIPSVRKISQKSEGSSKGHRRTEKEEETIHVHDFDRAGATSPQTSVHRDVESPHRSIDFDEYEEEEIEDEEHEELLKEIHGSSGGISSYAHHKSFSELPYGFNPATTEAVYYVGSTGDIINCGKLSDPDFSIPSCSSSEHSIEQSEYDGEDYWETEDDEEDADILRFSAYFTETIEQSLTEAECHEIKEGLEYLTRTGGVHHHGFTFHTLDMSERQLHDLSMVEHFTSLKSINLSRNFLRNVRGLGSMSHLVKVDASKNEIEEFLDIYSEQSLLLREVNFSKNKITKILDLQPFWALTSVNLSYNKLTVIDGFQTCTYLRVLNLSHNNITEINNLNCPNLVILLLKFNDLTTIEGIEECGNLRYLSISNNQISELNSLKALPELMELRCQENKIDDLLELEHLKALIHLSHLCLQPNPCMEVGMSRLLLIHMLPQVRYLDGKQITPDEILEAKNTFNPSFEKLAFEDHTNAMLEKACQSSNKMFDEFCKFHPIPPIILLVGSSKSNSNRLALHLKEKLKHEVLLGGVHSTATTIEGGNHCNVDIPVSYNSFLEMKYKGEFLATSHILGRLCGFATSQIARAAEKGAILVASVPLITAICIRKWKFRPKYVLILPSDRPQFNVDQFIRTHSEKIKTEQESAEETEEIDEVRASRHTHIVSFVTNASPETRHTVESASNFLTPAAILKHNSIGESTIGSDDASAYRGGLHLLNQSSSGPFEIGSLIEKVRSTSEADNIPHVTKEGNEQTVSLRRDQLLQDIGSFEEEESITMGYNETMEEVQEDRENADLYNHPIYSRHPLHLMKVGIVEYMPQH